MTSQLDASQIKGPVIVIAPHPDDETLGCGGLIAALAGNGIVVHTIFVTDGSSSHRNSPTWPAERLAQQRRVEATNALSLLGAGNQPRTFLMLKDAGMPAPGETVYEAAMEAVLAVLNNLKPGLVIAPWRRDPHCDHQDAFSLIVDALGRAAQSPDLLEYTIWLDELGAPDDFPVADEVEVVEFVSPNMIALKRAAIAAHETQMSRLIPDDPSGFFLTESTLDRLIKPSEIYWRI